MEEQVGQNLALGIGEGFEKNIGAVNKEITDAMNFDDASVNVNASRSGVKGGGVTVYQTNNYKQAYTSPIPLTICEMARDAGLEKVYLHMIFDGRSTEPGSAPALLLETDARLDAIGVGRIVDGVGRGIVLDRDGNYDEVKRAYDAMVEGCGRNYC